METSNDGHYSSEEILNYLESVIQRELDIIHRMYALEMVARHKIDGRNDTDVATIMADCLSHLRDDANRMINDAMDIIKHNNQGDNHVQREHTDTAQ